jgi:hypothetical protein
VIGSWRRSMRTRRVEVEVQPWLPLTSSQWRAVEKEVAALGRFLDLPATIS